MIPRASFIMAAEGLNRMQSGTKEYAWIIPIRYVLAWDSWKVYIIPNSIDALDEPQSHHLVAFPRADEVEAAFATYRIMNSGVPHD